MPAAAIVSDSHSRGEQEGTHDALDAGGVEAQLGQLLFAGALVFDEAIGNAEDAHSTSWIGQALLGLQHGGAKSAGALEMAKAYLQDQTLSREAEYAVVKITEAVAADLPDLAKSTLKEIIEKTKNDTLREQARGILDKME